MKKTGFTLIEILGVITVIGILAMIIYPVVSNVIRDNKQKLYDQQIKSLEIAASNWATNNGPILEEIAPYLLTFEEMKESGFLNQDDLINPITGEYLEGCIRIVWDEETNQYRETYIKTCSL